MQQSEMNLDLTKTTPVNTSTGGKVWVQGVILRKVSKFITGTSEDALVPIPVFYDPDTKEILEDSIPKELREELINNN